MGNDIKGAFVLLWQVVCDERGVGETSSSSPSTVKKSLPFSIIFHMSTDIATLLRESSSTVDVNRNQAEAALTFHEKENPVCNTTHPSAAPTASTNL